MSRDVLLISCVYEKRSRPSAARDLYRGPLFERSRAYAEQQPHPWFILSGEHGLVKPTDWLAPYNTDLNDTSPAYRQAWGTWVVAKLGDAGRGLVRRRAHILGAALMSPSRPAGPSPCGRADQLSPGSRRLAGLSTRPS